MKFIAALSLVAAVSAQTGSMGSMAGMDTGMTNHTSMGATHASMTTTASNNMAGMPMVKRHGPNDDGDSNSTMAGMAGMPMAKRHGPNDDGDSNSTMAGMAGMPMKRHGPNDDGDSNSTMTGMAGMPMKRHGPNDDGDNNSTMAGMAGMPMAKRHGPNDDGDSNSTMAGMAGMPMAKRHGPNDDGDNNSTAMAGMPMKRQTMTMASMHSNDTTMAQHEKMPGHADAMSSMASMGMKKRHGPAGNDEKPGGSPTMKACSTSSVMAGSMMDPNMVMAPGSTMPMRMSAKFRRALVARGILC